VGRLTFSSGAGIALAAAACLMLLMRLPGAYSAFTDAAKAAAGRNELGGALATADSLSLNDDFVRNAFATVPKTGRFAVVLPRDEAAIEKADGVSPITFDGVAALFADYLLPRRQLQTPTKGTYIICFYCDTAAWSGRTHWLAPEVGGGRVGYVIR
jgi:hypothetical protein